jgi:peptidoglycan/xylan/chitin deacetylase (PgdA/CDA1 family)
MANWSGVKQQIVRFAGPPAGVLAAHLLRLTGRRIGAAVMYHRVGDPPGNPARELVPKLSKNLFESQVLHLQRCYRLVPASELPLAAASRRRGQKLPLAITFDDDLASHVRVAAPILERLGVTATFFLTGASLRSPFNFWWQRLQVAVDRGLADEVVLEGVTPQWLADPARRRPEDIHELAASMQTMERSGRETIERRLANALGPQNENPGLSAADVRTLAGAGHEIAFHTRRHEYLPTLRDDELERAMHEGRDELAEVAEKQPLSIAYPHGGTDARVAGAARAAGYRVGYTTTPNSLGRATDPLLAGRIEASFASRGDFAMDLIVSLIRAR